MKKVLKFFFLSLLSLIVVFVIAVLIITHSIDPNAFKPAIIRAVYNSTGRTLHFGGDVETRLFPLLQVRVTNVSLSNAEGFAPDNMIEIEELKVRVKILPLIWKRIEVYALSIQGLNLFYTINKDGVSNISDLISTADKKPEHELEVQQYGSTDRTVFYLDLERTKILSLTLDDVSVRYKNEMTGMTVTVRPFRMRTGIIAKNIPVPIDIYTKVYGDNPDFIGDLNFRTILVGNFDHIHFRNTTAVINYYMAAPHLQAGVNIQTEGSFNTRTGILDLRAIQLNADLAALELGQSEISGAVRSSFSGSFNTHSMMLHLTSNKFRMDSVDNITDVGDIWMGSDLNVNMAYDIRSGIINMKAEQSGTVRTDMSARQQIAFTNTSSAVDVFFDLKTKKIMLNQFTMALRSLNYRSDNLSGSGDITLSGSGVFYPPTMTADLKDTSLAVDAQNFRILDATMAGTASANFDGQYSFRKALAIFDRLEIDLNVQGVGRFQPGGLLKAALATAGSYDIGNSFIMLNNAHLESSGSSLALAGMNLAGSVGALFSGSYDLAGQLIDVNTTSGKATLSDAAKGQLLDMEFLMNGTYDIPKAVLDMKRLNISGDYGASWVPAGRQSLSADTVFWLDVRQQLLSLKKSKLNFAGINAVISGEFQKLFSAPDMKVSIATNEFSPRNTLHMLNMASVLQNFKPKAFTRARIQSDFTYQNKILTVPARLVLDGTAGRVGARIDFNKPKADIAADIDIDKADIQLYLPSRIPDSIGGKDKAAPEEKKLSEMDRLIAALYNSSRATVSSNFIQVPEISFDKWPDLRLSFAAGKLLWGRHEFQSVTLDATVAEGALDVEKLAAVVYEGRFFLRGSIVRTPNRYEMALESGLSNVDLPRAAAAFGVKNVINYPQKASLLLDAEFSNNILTLSSAAFQADDMSASLSAQMNFGRIPALNFTLNVTEIDLERYIPESKPDDGVQAEVPVKTLREGKQERTIDDTPFDITGRITVQSLKYKRFTAHNLVSDISVSNGRGRIRSNFAAFGGTVDANLTATGAWAYPVCDAVMNINLIRAGEFIRMISDQDNSFLSGLVTAHAYVSYTGLMTDDILRTLNGRVTYSVRDAVLNGIGYDPNILSLDRIRNLILLDSTNRTEINNFNGELVITDGVVFVSPVTAISRNIVLNISGDIGLYSRTLDLNGSVNLVGGQDVPLSITGTMSEPDVFIDMVALRNSIILQITRSTGRGVLSLPVDVIQELSEQLRRRLNNLLPENLQR